MKDLCFQIGLSNACFALVLALVALLVGAKSKRPHLAHLLWLMVLIKLVTPPLLSLPVIPSSGPLEESVRSFAMPVTEASELAPVVDEHPARVEILRAVVEHGKAWFVVLWLAGSALVLCWSLVRVVQFHRLLGAHSESASAEVQAAAMKIAGVLGLRKLPMILATSAQLSPMVWWAGGRVRVILPSTLLETMSTDRWSSVLSHELAHVRRATTLCAGWSGWPASSSGGTR